MTEDTVKPDISKNSNWVAVGLILAVFLLLKSCFFKSPNAEDTIKEYLKDIESGNTVDALALMKNDTLNVDGITHRMGQMEQVFRSKHGVAKVTVQKPSNGDEGIYGVYVEYGNGEKDGPLYIKMLRSEDNRWLIGQTR